MTELERMAADAGSMCMRLLEAMDAFERDGDEKSVKWLHGRIFKVLRDAQERTPASGE